MTIPHSFGAGTQEERHQLPPPARACRCLNYRHVMDRDHRVVGAQMFMEPSLILFDLATMTWKQFLALQVRKRSHQSMKPPSFPGAKGAPPGRSDTFLGIPQRLLAGRVQERFS
ncbi:hypothetical protein P7K49_026087 [Saguinus oedipus]|uniref:Uncharacterized protein n=1 Tax=Saguinus oedipus TaxID=9490 RepID=A0ABQ9UJ06_SAGOE|nr:hypothetical protein P7K49_026087 [Saguinus oedipus]